MWLHTQVIRSLQLQLKSNISKRNLSELVDVYHTSRMAAKEKIWGVPEHRIELKLSVQLNKLNHFNIYTSIGRTLHYSGDRYTETF